MQIIMLLLFFFFLDGYGFDFDMKSVVCFMWMQLIFPYLDLNIKYFDLGVQNRDATEDRVTVESAEATLKWVNFEWMVAWHLNNL